MKKILFVDDEPNVLAAFQRQLRRQFAVETAPGGREALALLEKDKARDYAVVVADMRMPEMNGVEFLARVKVGAPEIVRMMLTGNADQGTAIDAINEGNIFRFLTKPCAPEKLIGALEAALRQHQLITAERELLENTLSGSVNVLAEILALTEPKASNNAEGLRDDLRALSAYLKLPRPWEIQIAAMLSRIGQVTIPPEVALKARLGHALSPREQEMFSSIPAIGGSLLAHIPRMEEVSRIILYQNKCFDGSGFPNDSVAGANIPLGARILKAFFNFAELEASGKSRAAALILLRAQRGAYDPQILDAIAGCFQITIKNPAASKQPPVPIPFPSLRVGHQLVSDIQTKDGILIVSAGNRITPALIQRLRNFAALSGIREPLYVEAAFATEG